MDIQTDFEVCFEFSELWRYVPDNRLRHNFILPASTIQPEVSPARSHSGRARSVRKSIMPNDASYSLNSTARTEARMSERRLLLL